MSEEDVTVQKPFELRFVDTGFRIKEGIGKRFVAGWGFQPAIEESSGLTGWVCVQ